MRIADPCIEDKPAPIPYRLLDQWLLLVPARDAESAEKLLAERGVPELEELFYDRDGSKHANGMGRDRAGSLGRASRGMRGGMGEDYRWVISSSFFERTWGSQPEHSPSTVTRWTSSRVRRT